MASAASSRSATRWGWGRKRATCEGSQSNAFSGGHCDPCHLALFNRTVDDARAFLLSQDVIYVGGGNTVNLLAVWRAQGLDVVLREAWERGMARREYYLRAIEDGLVDGIAAEDGVALHFVEHRLAAVVASREGRRAHRVGVSGGRVVEAPLRPVVLDAQARLARARRPSAAQTAPAALAAVP